VAKISSSGTTACDLLKFVAGCSRRRVHLLPPIQAGFAVALSQVLSQLHLKPCYRRHDKKTFVKLAAMQLISDFRFDTIAGRNHQSFLPGELEMPTRLFLISLLVVIFTAIVFLPIHSRATQSETIWVWCMSDTSAPTVYFTGPFDSGLSARSTTFDTLSLGRQFAEYLKGKFNTKGDATCGHGATSVDQAGALQTMRQLMAQPRSQNKQVVELSDFKYVRDETAIKATFTPSREGNTYNNVAAGLRNDHIYCVTGPFNNTVYYADVIPLANPASNPTADYFRFLQQKYSFKGDLACPILNEPQAKLYLNARLTGARAGGMQVVNAG